MAWEKRGAARGERKGPWPHGTGERKQVQWTATTTAQAYGLSDAQKFGGHTD